MTTLNSPEAISHKESFAALPQLPRDEDGPVFAEPWQAQAVLKVTIIRMRYPLVNE